MTLARIRPTSSTRRTECSRCLRPITPNVRHWLIGTERVGTCCIRPDERTP